MRVFNPTKKVQIEWDSINTVDDIKRVLLLQAAPNIQAQLTGHPDPNVVANEWIETRCQEDEE